MNDVQQVCIHVSTIDGNCLLEETHCIAFGPGGLLRVLERLDFAAENLLCFPTREKIPEVTSKGAPLLIVCDIMKLGCEPSLSALLRVASYDISEESVAMVWVRAEIMKKYRKKLRRFVFHTYIYRRDMFVSRLAASPISEVSFSNGYVMQRRVFP